MFQMDFSHLLIIFFKQDNKYVVQKNLYNSVMKRIWNKKQLLNTVNAAILAFHGKLVLLLISSIIWPSFHPIIALTCIIL